jgi:HPt (histidine-containing phosphotransfer) domain-containing protein
VVLDPAAIDRLVVAFGDDGRQVVAELVATFLAEAPRQLASLRHGIAVGDEREVRRAAHSLKSSAATLGALDLAGVCRVVEAGSGEGYLAAVSGLVDDLDAVLDAAGRALEVAVG